VITVVANAATNLYKKKLEKGRVTCLFWWFNVFGLELNSP